jgi:alpha-D-ribose 1-methylphosphonate 5-triphosphate synthase subunit PhnH
MHTPVQTAAEAADRSVFLALMWSLSYPGRPQLLPAGASAQLAVGHALLDIETRHFSTDADFGAELVRTGSMAVPIESAGYVFLPKLTEATLPLLERVHTGSYLYPDTAATLVIGCTLNDPSGREIDISGPGVINRVTVRVGGLPEAFWSVRASLIQYPLGVDIFLVDATHVLGIPRTSTCM